MLFIKEGFFLHDLTFNVTFVYYILIG